MPRKRKARPYRRDEWLGDIIQYGRECTAERAWTRHRNLAGLIDGLCERAEAASTAAPTCEVEMPRWVCMGLVEYARELGGAPDGLVQELRDALRPTGDGHWLTAATLISAVDYMRATCEKYKRIGQPTGRHALWAGWYEDNAKHFARFESVHGLHFNRGLSWPAAYDKVADDERVLAGKAAEAANGGGGRLSRDTVEASYKRVRRDLNEGRWGAYYFSRRIKIIGFVDTNP